jgi:acetyl-CoA carboxylase carboxyl transferase subunit alpha
MRHYLDFEKKLEPLERRVHEIERFYDIHDPHYAREAEYLAKKIVKVEKEIYSDLSSWQRVQLSRHLNRPHTLDYIHNLFTDFVELHGDRKFRDDSAIVAGFARFNGMSVAIVGHQKGKDVREMAYRNFGMANPDGYRKSMRVMEMASRWNKPIITFIDTAGAYPGLGAEERGQAEAIASSIYLMFSLGVPVISIVIGEGGSGGALAIGVGNRILMLENANYSIITPEGCAAILWRDDPKGPSLAADAMKLISYDLLKLGVVDEIIGEPFGGAHRDWKQTFTNAGKTLDKHLKELMEMSAETLKQKRYEKFRNMGIFEEKM